MRDSVVMGTVDQWRRRALEASLAVGVLLAVQGRRAPDPRSADAPADEFSAGRAMADVRELASAPHPLGSTENARVRDYLFGRMTSLRLSPEVQRGWAFGRNGGVPTFEIGGGEVANLVGVLPGRDRRAPAVALMAHYDSRRGSPGAADDAAGVAAALEIARILAAAGPPARDVVFIITDGEEAGLLGARVFFDEHPLARRIGLVFNLEARGGGGRTWMFQTSLDNGSLISLYRRAVADPASNSLAGFIYRIMPNDTDLTVALNHGIAGLNFAFIGTQFDYHAPSSTPENLDQGSLQHLGDQVLALTREVAQSAELPGDSEDATYGDLFGRVMIVYPASAGWILLVAAALLAGVGAARARRLGALRGSDVARGAAAALALLVVSAAVLGLARQALGLGLADGAKFSILAQFDLWATTLTVAALAVLISIPVLFGRRGQVAGMWAGVLATGFGAALALQIAAPTAAYVVVWPLLLASAAAAATALAAERRPWTSLLVGVLAAAVIGWLGVYFLTVAEAVPRVEALALFPWLAAFLAWPLLQPESFRRADIVAGGVLLALVIAGVAVVRFGEPWDRRYPRAANPLYLVDADAGRSWRVAAMPEVDPWSAQLLRAGRGEVTELGLAPLVDERTLPTPAHASPAPHVAAPPMRLEVDRAGAGDGERVTVHATPTAEGAFLIVAVRSSVALREPSIGGRPVASLAGPGEWTRIVWYPGAEGLSLSFRPAGAGSLEIRHAQITPGWPASQPLPPVPPDTALWLTGGSTMVTGTYRK